MNRWTFIRQIAAQTLADYQAKTGQAPFGAEHGVHAVLDKLVEECLGLMLFADEQLPENVQGALNHEEGTICYHPALPIQRRALVIAHEIGHHQLDHPPRQIQDNANHINEQPLGDQLLAQNGVQPTYNTRDRWELEANIFAAELLAPAGEVRKRVSENWPVAEMARYFGVSRAAMYNQLAAVLLCNPHESREEPAENATSQAAWPLSSATSPETSKSLPMDEQQTRAARVQAPALIVAGPGAGKTRVLIERFQFLVNNGADPRRILALTFSNKAAAEMRERLCVALPGREYEINVFTFHSFGLQLMLAYGEVLGYRSVKVLSQTDAFVLMRDHLHTLPMGSYESLTSPTRFLNPLLSAFSRAKDELCDPQQFRLLAEKWVAKNVHDTNSNFLDASQLDTEKQKARECAEAANIYAAYQALLREHGFLDYGDLIAQSVRLFDHPEIALKICGDYDHILVDEFQDINYASGRLVKALDGGNCKVWAVGDPRQNIYSFRGASRANIADFQRDYPNASVLNLTVNYRSVEEIVQAGQAVAFPIAQSEQSLFPPELHAFRGRTSSQPAMSQPAIQVAIAPDSASEVVAVAALVADLVQNTPPNDIAVLCRTNATARKVSATLEARDIPTNWSGNLEERAAFKDLIGVLLLATDSPHGLLRVSRLGEHRFDEADLRLLMTVARGKRSALSALYDGAQGEIAGFSEAGRAQAERLKTLAGTLQALPDAWRVLAFYVFEAAAWTRAVLFDDSLPARRARATIGQLANLAREFSLKNDLPGESDTQAFLDYLRACRQCGTLDCSDAMHVLPGAVTVTTIHKSKGLEWPIVLLPGLVNRPHLQQEVIPLPPGLIRGAAQNDDAYDAACVFYVGVTRARDRLVLSRFESEGNNRVVPASPHLNELITKLESSGCLEHFAFQALNNSHADAVAGEQSWLLPDPIPYRMLDCYERCSQQFKYKYVYELDDDDKTYLTFHTVLYQTLEWINHHAGNGRVPSDHEIVADLSERWNKTEKFDARLNDVYRRGAENHALSFAHRAAPGKAVVLRGKQIVALEGHNLELIVDEIEPGPIPILRQHKLGKRSKGHAEQSILTLLSLVEAGELAPEIRLRYLEEEEICTKTNRFHTLRRRKIAQIISDIQQGKFAPSPNESKCAACSFNFICPA